MAKRNNAAPGLANNSPILASAESLGRMIGALQRQLGTSSGSTKKATSGSRKKRKPKPPSPKTKTTERTKTKRRG